MGEPMKFEIININPESILGGIVDFKATTEDRGSFSVNKTYISVYLINKAIK